MIFFRFCVSSVSEWGECVGVSRQRENQNNNTTHKQHRPRDNQRRITKKSKQSISKKKKAREQSKCPVQKAYKMISFFVFFFFGFSVGCSLGSVFFCDENIKSKERARESERERDRKQ